MSDLEMTFLRQIEAEPENALHRLVYADWLEEQGDPRGELLRIQEQLRRIEVPDRPRVEQRMHQLIAQGVQPLTITHTNSIGMKFVLIFPGEFLMGSPPEESNRRGNEGFVEVTLPRAFWLGQFVVRQAEWEAVMGSAPWRGEEDVKEGDDFPATYVSWEDAVDFCEKLTAQESLPSGCRYTLPTEAQWEYSCRAGTRTRFSFGDDLSQLEHYAWYQENAWLMEEGYAHQVGQKHPNPWNLSDMHGNVWEWCRDGRVNKLPGGTDPEVVEQAPTRVNRGGNWYQDGGHCRSASRSGAAPGHREYDQGFRLALVQPGTR